MLQNFSYLKGSLCGTVVVVIGGISITNDSYDIIIELLKGSLGKEK